LAIFQVLYGSWELYVARGKQLDTYGYAAFSLTVVPYIAMSLLNLIATICQPQYSHVYLVRYGKDIPSPVEKLNSLMVGTIATVMTPQRSQQDRYPPRIANSLDKAGAFNSNGCLLKNWRPMAKLTSARIFAACAYLAPYIVAYMLTGFEPRSSTLFERAWIYVWLVFGQIVGLTAVGNPRIFSLRARFMVPKVVPMGIVVAAPAVGVFTIVAQMILQVGTCEAV
jgi:hypothetical protein